jgi:hypothetical protein
MDCVQSVTSKHWLICRKANPKPKEAEKPVELEKKEDDQKVKYQG